jgi:hypothetical protein
MSVPPPCRAANSRGAVAKIALSRSVFLKKSRLFFIVLPLKELGGPKCPAVAQRTLDPSEEMQRAIEIKSLPLPLLLEGEEKTQMRRTLKEAVYAEGRDGGPLSKLQALSTWEGNSIEDA